MIYFTSDEHYGHRNIIEYCKRPYADVDEMTEDLIYRHNQRVKDGDSVYHLGDMFWRSFGLAAAISVMDRLNGTHYYIRGNHEELIDNYPQLRDRFVWVKDLAKINCTPAVVLCHYAMRVWPGGRGAWQLYGHSHGTLLDNGSLSMDVGVDAVGYAPISLLELCRL